MSDLIAALAVLSLASAAIGALLEYVGHSIHEGHRRE